MKKGKNNISFWLDFSKNCDIKMYSIDYFKKNTALIFWSAVSMREDLPLAFIEEFRDSLSWVELSKIKTDIEFFKQFQDKIKWSVAINSGKEFLSVQENIRYFADTMDFTNLSHSKYITNDLIEEFPDEICWNSIMKNSIISPSVKEKYKYKLDTR